MSLGTKNRQTQTAAQCREHLRDVHKDKLVLVNEYIAEIEGTGKTLDITLWSQFTDSKDVKVDTLARLDAHFEKWLNPE